MCLRKYLAQEHSSCLSVFKKPKSHITMSKSVNIRQGYCGRAAPYRHIHQFLHPNWRRPCNAEISVQYKWMQICMKLSLRDVINQKWMHRHEMCANEQTRRGWGGVNDQFRFLDSGDNHLLFSDKRRGRRQCCRAPLWAAAWILVLCCDYL